MGFLDGVNEMCLGDIKQTKGNIPNTHHFLVLLGRVYAKVAKVYDKNKQYNYSTDIRDLIMENNLLSLCTKMNKVADCDVVNVFEATRWSILYLQENERVEFIPVLVEDLDLPGNGREVSGIYNAFICDTLGKSIEEYPEYSYFKENTVLRILDKCDFKIEPKFNSES